MRYRLRTLLIVLAIGLPSLWAIAVLFEAYRYLKSFPDPGQRYFVSRQPIAAAFPAMLVLQAAATVVVTWLVVRFTRKRN